MEGKEREGNKGKMREMEARKNRKCKKEQQGKKERKTSNISCRAPTSMHLLPFIMPLRQRRRAQRSYVLRLLICPPHSSCSTRYLMLVYSLSPQLHSFGAVVSGHRGCWTLGGTNKLHHL